jgi:voltage-gated potassium channel
MSTVGFGDIHAAGSLARLIVTVHMVFNLIYLGTALRWLTWHQPADE